MNATATAAVPLLFALLASSPLPASASEGSWGGHLAAGANIPSWEAGSAFFFVDLGASYGVAERLDVELSWTFGFLRQEDRHESTGGVFFSLLQPGVRYRFVAGPVTPYAAAHLGLQVAHGDLQIGGEDASETSVGLAFDVRAGVELALDPSWSLDAFVAYARATNVVTPASDFTDTAGVGVVLIGVGVLFRD